MLIQKNGNIIQIILDETIELSESLITDKLHLNNLDGTVKNLTG